MAFTVKKLAKISGVSVRTLHWYDEIGLLKPAYLGDNQYRYYEEEQLLILQQILFFKELGFNLNDIQNLLAQKDFDKMKSLQAHRQVMTDEIDRKNQLINTIDKTIMHLRGKVTMKAEEMFYGLDSDKQKHYENILIEKYGEDVKVSINEAKRYITDKGVKKWQQEIDALYKKIVELININALTDSPEVQSLMPDLYKLVSTKNTSSKQGFKELAQMYQESPDFKRFFDAYHPKMLDFIVAAMEAFANKNL